ncbi:hypothetical protein B0H17DRAFT_1151047 [Mycena rosella]|uniref:SAP domain-containing protein n=1 Tax=Mycena rosella TaxID=1033263 RepID=A0AAD7BNZ6_MYCRO|nr:hypothetical protein B0H17DRAFT_1151047 [Mycena rosella]
MILQRQVQAVNCTLSVIADLCRPLEGGTHPLCTDKDQEDFPTVLKRLSLKDLQDIAKKHGIKVKRAKTELVKALNIFLSQKRIDSPQPIKELLMPEIRKKLDVLKKCRLEVHEDVQDALKPLLRRYFLSETQGQKYNPEIGTLTELSAPLGGDFAPTDARGVGGDVELVRQCHKISGMVAAGEICADLSAVL